MPISIPTVKKVFFFLVSASLFSVLILYRELSFPYITSKVLFFRVLILMALPCYVYLLAAQKELRPNLKNPVTLFVLLFFLANLLSGIFGINWGRSFWGNFERMGGIWYLLHLALLYFYLLAIAAVNGVKLKQILKTLVYLGVAASIYGLLTRIGFPDGFYPDDALPVRVSSFFGNPIFFASFLIFPTCFSAFFAAQAEHMKDKRWWLAALAINLLGIYLSATRGAFLGILGGGALAFFVWTLLNKNYKHRLLGLGSIAAALLVFLLFIAGSTFFPEGSVLRRVTDFGDSNTRARIIQWTNGIKGFKERPLLGVGPENYYVIGNKYFDADIYQYDRSWFDKPHNYPLEVLLTGGILGFLSYAGLIVFSFYAGLRAYRFGMISSLEFAILAGGIAAYQIQNVFVFDTVSASMAFFAFTGFAGFLWQESTAKDTDQKHLKKSGFGPGALKFVGGATIVLVLYGIYVTDYLPARAMSDLNNGVTAGIHNPVAAKEYFEKTMADTMNFDYNESATKYEEFASELALSFQDPKDKEFVIESVRGALVALDKAIARVSNDPILWFKLTNMRSTLGHSTGAPYDTAVEEAAKTSISFAPGRVEPRYFLVQAYQLKKDYKAAAEEEYNVIKIDPSNPFNFWRLALVYKESGDLFRAYKMALYARKNGYEFRNLAEAQWLAKYYSDLNQFGELSKLYEELIKNGLANFQTYANLATTYAQMGERDKARAMAYKVLEINPESKASVEAFLKKLDSGEPF